MVAILAVLFGLWGVGKLPIESVWQQVRETRAKFARLAEIAQEAAATATPGRNPTATPFQTPGLLAMAVPTMTSDAELAAALADTGNGLLEPLVTLSPSPAEAITPVPATGAAAGAGKFYTVKAGDTLAAIGERLGIPWQEIAQLNGISQAGALQIGQKLALPAPTAVPTVTRTATAAASPTASPTATLTGRAPATAAIKATPSPTGAGATPVSGATTYRVKAGDTLAGIGALFGVSWETIASANNISAATTLQVGQQLIIPVAGGAAPTATPRPKATATRVSLSPTPEALLPAPILISPSDKLSYNDEKATIALQWNAVPGMPQEAVYQVILEWKEGGLPQKADPLRTPRLSIPVPAWLWQRADQPDRAYIWTVQAIQVGTDGQGGERVVPLSQPSLSRTFSWH